MTRRMASTPVHSAAISGPRGEEKGTVKPTEGRPTYLAKLKPEFAHLPDYGGRIEIGRTYRAFFSRDHADFMSIVGTGITHAQKRHFEIRPG